MTSTGTARINIVESLDATTAEHARTVLEAALNPDERDDRFDRWPTEGDGNDDGAGLGPTPAGFIAALASVDGAPVGFVGGDSAGGRLQLDAIIAPPPSAGSGASTDAWRAALLTSILDELTPRIVEASPTATATTRVEVELWAKPAHAWHDAVAASYGMVELRALHQMRCGLPVAADPLPSRSYTAEDFDELLAVNNRAFASHPDQGAQTAASFAASMTEPWFLADGVRLHVRDGRLAGFCWTKIHPSPPAMTELGEIYVIGVDPDFHGQGLGVPMTAAGLAWLADRGIGTGMLYVEADNVPAIKTYERLGFTVLRTDRAWLWSPAAESTRSR